MYGENKKKPYTENGGTLAEQRMLQNRANGKRVLIWVNGMLIERTSSKWKVNGCVDGVHYERFGFFFLQNW